MTEVLATQTETDTSGRSKRKKKRAAPTERVAWSLALLAAPGVVYFLVFAYLPMAGLIVAFKDFNVSDGIFGSPWNGVENFEYFISTGNAARIIINTVFLNALFLTATLAWGLTLAIMLNEIRLHMYKRVTQSVVFFPYFVSPIVISVMLQVLLAGVGGEGGAVNDMLNVFNLPSLTWYTEPGAWPWILTIVKVWQLGGYMSVIFLAAITAIPPDVYEAGVIDGASRARMAWSITVPLLRPTAAILLVLGIGRIFYGDFAVIYAIIGDNGVLFSTTDVIDTYVFRSLRSLGDFGTTAAIGLFQAVLGFIFVSVAVIVQRRYARDSSIL
ncbi:ABC transporter permease subunit [Phytoactinopolyspora endophytica]|uniref:ABC transporter permease subunit n=1 Tax=Phytoactinopolyspora endophytica TaxID=1642495 RepID=UPI00101D6566|nr:ABC transporter permease subunit [Phytoactinopolyspora endophytica]